MIKRISLSEVIVEGNPASACSPTKFWHVVQNGINPVFDGDHPIQYSIEAGEAIYASDLPVQEPDKKVIPKVEVAPSA